MAGKRRDYKAGSVYQRSSDGRWIGTVEAGYTATGARRRVTVSARTEPQCKRKLREKQKEIETHGVPAAGSRTTVAAWTTTYLAMRETDLRPKAYATTSSSLRRHVVPVIGHRRLADLTPGDIRAVDQAQRKATPKPLSGNTIAATRRTLMTMLRAALLEGHPVPPRVLLVKPPTPGQSDRMDVTLPAALAILDTAQHLPHGTRWVFALMHGMRQGECLGLTWDSIDLTRDIVTVQWQLQALPYRDRSDRALGFRVPDDHTSRRLIDAWHLVQPKSRKGLREIPLVPAVREALLAWQEIAPDNPWGLVWATTEGRPANPKHDLTEWHALQCTAGVGHPAGRYYHLHEARNLTATQLDEIGASDNVITSLLGHASILTSRGYMRAHEDTKRAALEAVGERLLPRVEE